MNILVGATALIVAMLTLVVLAGAIASAVGQVITQAGLS